ncbi:MAG: Ger(x)C family spore germination protein [Ectobacillus sp.]
MHRIGLILLSVLLLSGCGAQKKILEDVQLTRTIGFDEAEGNKVRGTVALMITPPGQNVQPRTDILTNVSYTGKGIRQLLQAESPKPILVGKVRTVLYGEKVAHSNLYRYVDTLQRDPNIGRDVYLAITEGETMPFLQLRSPMSQGPGMYIEQLLEQNSKTNFPKTDLHHFLYHYLGKGLDPIMPLLSLRGNHIFIKGIALFKKGKYIGKYIPYKQGFIFKALYEPFERGMYEIQMKPHGFITIQNIGSSVKYKILNGSTNPAVHIFLSMKGRVVESPDLAVRDFKAINKFEAQIEKQIQKEALKMMRMFQKEHIDPLGIGDRARSQTRNFNIKKWEKQYASIPIYVKVNVQITQAGIAE